MVATGTYGNSIIANISTTWICKIQRSPVRIHTSKYKRYAKRSHTCILRELLGHICNIFSNPFHINWFVVD